MALETRLVAFLADSKPLASDTQMREHFGDEYPKMADLLNTLLEQHRVQIFQQGTELLYKLVSEESAAKTVGLVPDEMLVLQAIEKSGDKGIWFKHLRTQTGLQQHNLTKVIRRLEGRRLIKLVKSVTFKNRKIYMLFDTTPSKELTGGTFYSADTLELDHEFIEYLRKFLKRELRKKPQSCAKLAQAVGSAGISQVTLTPLEVKTLLDTLVFDGEVERVTMMGEEDTADVKVDDMVYQAAGVVGHVDSFTEMPCGYCPVIHLCKPGGVVSPEKCPYLTKWLEF